MPSLNIQHRAGSGAEFAPAPSTEEPAEIRFDGGFAKAAPGDRV
jgi:hypothetical protein